MGVVGAVSGGGGERAMSGSVAPSVPAAGNEVQEVKMKVLAGENDEHGGVIVEMKEAMDSEAFLSLLRASIAHWRLQVCGLWFLFSCGIFLGFVVIYLLSFGFVLHVFRF